MDRIVAFPVLSPHSMSISAAACSAAGSARVRTAAAARDASCRTSAGGVGGAPHPAHPRGTRSFVGRAAEGTGSSHGRYRMAIDRRGAEVRAGRSAATSATSPSSPPALGPAGAPHEASAMHDSRRARAASTRMMREMLGILVR
jgi:hypothetical protein